MLVLKDLDDQSALRIFANQISCQKIIWPTSIQEKSQGDMKMFL